MNAPTIGRPRRDDVPREMRECRHHGLTEFAAHSNGKRRKWGCMACHREEALLRSMIAGTARIEECQANTARENHYGAQCPTCFEEMPLTGICDNCD